MCACMGVCMRVFQFQVIPQVRESGRPDLRQALNLRDLAVSISSALGLQSSATISAFFLKSVDSRDWI